MICGDENRVVRSAREPLDYQRSLPRRARLQCINVSVVFDEDGAVLTDEDGPWISAMEDHVTPDHAHRSRLMGAELAAVFDARGRLVRIEFAYPPE